MIKNHHVKEIIEKLAGSLKNIKSVSIFSPIYYHAVLKECIPKDTEGIEIMSLENLDYSLFLKKYKNVKNLKIGFSGSFLNLNKYIKDLQYLKSLQIDGFTSYDGSYLDLSRNHTIKNLTFKSLNDKLDKTIESIYNNNSIKILKFDYPDNFRNIHKLLLNNKTIEHLEYDVKHFTQKNNVVRMQQTFNDNFDKLQYETVHFNLKSIKISLNCMEESFLKYCSTYLKLNTSLTKVCLIWYSKESSTRVIKVLESLIHSKSIIELKLIDVYSRSDNETLVKFFVKMTNENKNIKIIVKLNNIDKYKDLNLERIKFGCYY